MILRIADHGHCCHRCKCTNETQLGKHYIFYPVGTTKDFDIGLYIPVELCSTCYDILLEKNQIADMYAQ